MKRRGRVSVREGERGAALSSQEASQEFTALVFRDATAGQGGPTDLEPFMPAAPCHLLHGRHSPVALMAVRPLRPVLPADRLQPRDRATKLGGGRDAGAGRAPGRHVYGGPLALLPGDRLLLV